MINVSSLNLPPLPLLLWETPPGLELILGQEGVAFAKVGDPHPLAFRGGRFVLYDARRVSAETVRATLTPEHVAIDVRSLFLAGTGRPVPRPGRHPGGPGPLGGRRPVAHRAGVALPQGPHPPSADRQASPGRHAGRRPLGAAGALPLPVSLGVQLPGRPRRGQRRGLRAIRPGSPPHRRLLHPLREHARLRRAGGRPRRPSPLRHPVARPLSRRSTAIATPTGATWNGPIAT